MINLEEFKAHVVKCYPQEACGVIVEDKFYPTDNVAADPINTFAFSTEASAKLQQLGKGYKIIHSHTMEHCTHDPRVPSEEDMKGQRNSGVEWGIVHCDGENVSQILWFGKPREDSLENRTYIPNVSDCFTIARDYFWQARKVDIGSHPRPAEWQEWNPHYILQTYAKIGFEEVKELQEGDVILFSVGSRNVNHIGIYVGEGNFIHHLYNRKSSIDILDKWKRQIVKYLRLKK